MLTERQLCDLVLIINGGFSPLQGFMNQADYNGCLDNMRLTDGNLFPMPITLDVDQAQIQALGIAQGARIALRDPRDDNAIATITVTDVYAVDKVREAKAVFGSDDLAHPAITYLQRASRSFYVGGEVQAISKPAYYDYAELRYTPAELRQHFAKIAWRKVVAFQTRTPCTAPPRAHRARRAPAPGQRAHPPRRRHDQPGDVDHYTRDACLPVAHAPLPNGMATLALLPLAMTHGWPARGALARHHPQELWRHPLYRRS